MLFYFIVVGERRGGEGRGEERREEEGRRVRTNTRVCFFCTCATCMFKLVLITWMMMMMLMMFRRRECLPSEGGEHVLYYSLILR